MEHTLFAIRDSTGYAALREIFLLHSLTNDCFVYIVALLAKKVSLIATSSTQDIVIGRLMTHIGEHVDISF